MVRKTDRGFTLIELMVVVTIIGICSAIVVPQLVSHKKSSDLADLVNMVQQTASQARSLALQTRRAIVIQVSRTTSQISVNMLSGAKCSDGVSQNNIQQALQLDAAPYSTAGAVLCNATVSVVSGTTCAAPANAGNNFGLCYSGTGDLYYRTGTTGTFVRSCLETSTGTNGAVLQFNRFAAAAPTNCTTDPLDVTRAVHLPVGGAPYSKVVIP